MQTAVNCTSVCSSAADLKQAAQKLSAIISDAQAVCRGLNSCTGISSGTTAELQRAILTAQENNAAVLRLYSICENAMREYYICENQLARNDVSIIISNTSTSAETESDIDWGTIRKMVGKFGVAGSITSSLWGLFEGGAATWKSGVKLIETGAKTIQKMADGKLVDLYGSFASKATTFSDELAKYVYDPSKCTTVAAKNASKISVAAKWVGTGFSALLNFSDNVEEYNADFTDAGMYVETVAETAFDVGVGAVAGVAASAIFTAVGVAFPPAWAVGIVTVGVSSVGNMINEGIEAVFGVDIKEKVADLAVDAANAVGKIVKDAGKLVGDAISATADCISAGWKKLTSLF